MQEEGNTDYASERVFDIVKQRDEIEEKLKELQIELEPLMAEGYDKRNKEFIDEEGFPKESLEWGKLTEYREKKRHFNELSVDFKKLTVEIEKALYGYHNNVKVEAEVEIKEYEKTIEDRSANNDMMVIEEKPIEKTEVPRVVEKVYQPFAVITEVTPGSPASEGGLKVGDVVIEYGEVNYLNHDNLKKIAEVTRKHIGLSIRVYFKRMQAIEIEVSVYPKEWAGPGVLGCRFEVLKN